MITTTRLLSLLFILPITFAPALATTALDDESKQAEIQAEELASARKTLKQFASALDEANFLAADYRQVRETFLFGTPIVSKGRMRLRREPACIRMDVREPKVAIIRSDATSHLTWHEGKPRAERLVFESNETAVTLVRLLTGNVAELEKIFEIKSYSTEEGVSKIGLVPIEKELAKQLKRLDLQIDAKTSLPLAVEHQNRDGEEVRIELSSTVVSKELPDAARIFDSPLPKGIKIVTRRIEKTE